MLLNATTRKSHSKLTHTAIGEDVLHPYGGLKSFRSDALGISRSRRLSHKSLRKPLKKLKSILPVHTASNAVQTSLRIPSARLFLDGALTVRILMESRTTVVGHRWCKHRRRRFVFLRQYTATDSNNYTSGFPKARNRGLYKPLEKKFETHSPGSYRLKHSPNVVTNPHCRVIYKRRQIFQQSFPNTYIRDVIRMLSHVCSDLTPRTFRKRRVANFPKPVTFV